MLPICISQTLFEGSDIISIWTAREDSGYMEKKDSFEIKNFSVYYPFMFLTYLVFIFFVSYIFPGSAQ